MTEGAQRAVLGATPRVLPVGLGRRVVIVANLGLAQSATASSTWASAGLSRSLDDWQGPGLLVVAGNLFDLTKSEVPRDGLTAALDAHQALAGSLTRFATEPDRRVVLVPGSTDAALAEDLACREVVEEMGLEVSPLVDLEMQTGKGARLVRVEPARGANVASVSAAIAADPEARWQEGLNRLADPGLVQRFLTSRLLYRRFARFAWWLLLPLAVALVLRLAIVTRVLDHLFLGNSGPTRALSHAHTASWASRLAVAGAVSAVELVILGLVLGWLGRRAWRALGGGHLDRLFA